MLVLASPPLSMEISVRSLVCLLWIHSIDILGRLVEFSTHSTLNSVVNVGFFWRRLRWLSISCWFTLMIHFGQSNNSSICLIHSVVILLLQTCSLIFISFIFHLHLSSLIFHLSSFLFIFHLSSLIILPSYIFLFHFSFRLLYSI